MCAALAAQSGVVVNEPEAWPGFTLIAPMTSTTTFLVNNEGEVIHTWQSDFAPGMSVYLLEDGSLLRPAVLDLRENTVFRGGGASGRVERYSWEGELIWEFEYASERFHLHHDVEWLPNGNVLMIAWEFKSAEEAIAAGRDPALLGGGALWPDHIIEVQPAGRSGGRIVWEWHAWDHLIQNHDPSKPNFGDPAEHPERIDLNYFRLRPNADWNHINSIDYNAERDEILLSVLGFDELWVIDHSTTTEEAAGSTGGRSGKGGGLLYRWGNPRTYGAGTQADQQFFALHDTEWIEPPLPGARNILVFVNGGNRPEGQWSSVVEIVPPVEAAGGYALEEGSAYGPAAPVWSYQAPVPEEFFSRNISGAQRLPNGNTLISSGASGHLFEVTAAGEIVWSYFVPLSDTGRSIFFRADRYGADYAGFAGRNLEGGAAAIVNAASYRLNSAAPGSIAAAFGTGLAAETAAAGQQPLPTELGGLRVEITDAGGTVHPAPLFFVSPTQVNFLVPEAIAPGKAEWKIVSGQQSVASGGLRIAAIAPGLFTADSSGSGAGLIVAVRAEEDGSQTVLPAFEHDAAKQAWVTMPIPLEGDVYLLVFGTGIRGAVPGELLTATIDGVDVPVIGAAPQSEFAGLDQVNIGPLPAGLAGRGEVTLVIAVGTLTANPVSVSF